MKRSECVRIIGMILIALSFSYCSAFADIIYVPADQPMIQLGIDAAADGDTVLVAPGTYWEHLNFNGKEISLQSEDRPSKQVRKEALFFGQFIVYRGHSPTSIINHFPVGVRAPRPVNLLHSCSWAKRRFGCCNGSKRTMTSLEPLFIQPWQSVIA